MAEKARGQFQRVRNRRTMMACGSQPTACKQHGVHQLVTAQTDQGQPLEFAEPAVDPQVEKTREIFQLVRKKHGVHQLVTVKLAQADQGQSLVSADPAVDPHVEDAYVDAMCNSVAEDLSTDLIHALEYWSSEAPTMATCEVTEPDDMRKLYLHMINSDPNKVLQKLAVPLKNKLLQSSRGAVLMEGPGMPIRLSQVNPLHSELLLEREAFCLGRFPSCDVQLDKDDATLSRIHMCMFNLPGALVIVDGWSTNGTHVTLEGEQHVKIDAKDCVCVVPHGQPVALQLGNQRLLLNTHQTSSATQAKSLQNSPLPPKNKLFCCGM